MVTMIDTFFLRKCLFIALTSAGAAFAIAFNFWAIFGFIFAALYVWVTSKSATRVLVALFDFTPSRRTKLVAAFATFMSLGGWLCLFLILTVLSPEVFGVAMFLSGVMWCALESYAAKRTTPQLAKEDEEISTTEPQDVWVYVGVFVYAVLYIVGLYLLYQSQSGGLLLSPWQTVHPHYIYIFALATLVLGILSITRLSIRAMVLLFIAHSFLMHGYLPFTHELFYGADGWRHLANVARIIAEQPLVVTVLSEAPSIGARLSVLAYGQLWGLMALLSRLLHIAPATLITWFVPVVWSVLFPVLLAEVAKTLSLGRRGTFYLLWASLVPFALQVAGSFTLPVNLGFLGWLLAIILVVKRLEQPRRAQVTVLALIGVLSLFTYSLYAILFWLGWVLVECILFYKGKKFESLVVAAAALVGGMIIPATELFMGYSSLQPVAWIASLKQLVGTMSAWYVATGPRPHDITAGNILFNQVPSYAFVPNIFTTHLGWLVVVAALFFFMVVRGVVYAFARKQPAYLWFGGMTILVTSSYVVSRYLLGGEQLFARRLDVVLAFLFIVVVVLVARHYDYLLAKKPRLATLLPLLLILDVVVISASYSLGPDTRTVRVREVEAMAYIWQQEQTNDKHCVIADTYPLLALEAVSGKEIVGGGFPINQYFAQPELSAVWQGFQQGKQPDAVWQQASEATGATKCWLVANSNILPTTSPEKVIDATFIWRSTH